MVFLLLLLVVGVFANFSSLRSQFRTLRKEEGNALWLWVLFFLAIVNFGKVESESVIVSNIFQLVTISVVSLCVVSLVFLRFKRVMSKMNAPVFFLIVYACFGIMSGAYSPFPAFSVYKASLIALSLLALLISMSYGTPYRSAKRLININLFFFFLIVLSAILGGIIDPGKATEYKQGMVFGMLKGWLILVNPNSLAVCAGALALFALSRFFGTRLIRQKFLYGGFFVTNFSTMLFAQSRTCVVAFLVALLVLMSRKRFKYLLLGAFIAIPLIGIYGASRFETNVEKYLRRGQSERQYQSWSGRLVAWEHSWDRFKESPLLGYGMEAGVRFGAVSKELQGSHLHSSYFETLINSGLIGFIPWFICLFLVSKGILARFVSFPKWFDTPMRNYHTEIAAIFIFLLVRTFAGTTFVRFDYFFMIYLALIGYLFAIRCLGTGGESADAAVINTRHPLEFRTMRQEKGE